MHHRVKLGLATLSLAGTLACGTEGPLEEADHVRTWATTASAAAVYFHFHSPLAVANDQAGYTDAACPVVTESGGVLTIRGDCTDDRGVTFVGEVTILRTERGDRTLEFEHFGSYEDEDFAATLDGRVDVRQIDPITHEFDADFVQEGITKTTYIYHGRVDGDYEGRTTWSGNGRVLREGFAEPTGIVKATTSRQVFDGSVCSGQPISGKTTLEIDAQVAVVSYDGETDCDEAASARWSVDGEDRGTLSGIACSAAPGAPASTTALGTFTLLLLAGIARRRAKPVGIGS